MQFSVYQQSHIGGRKVNQDRMGYSYTREALLLVLADGMGGHQRGEVAASIALQTMSTLFRTQAAPYVKKPERFLEEARIAAQLEHPNVVPVHEAGDIDGLLYITMRYVAGEDLRARLRRRSRINVKSNG